MKYMQNGGFQNNPLMRLTLAFTLLFTVGLWITNFLMFSAKMGFTPESIAIHYLGSEAQFIPPRTYQSLLEVTHFHLPMMAVIVLLLTHLVIFAPFSTRLRVLVIVGGFLSALINELSGWFIRYVSPHFAYLKLLSFWVFQITLAFLIVSLAWFLWMGAKGHFKKKKGR